MWLWLVVHVLCVIVASLTAWGLCLHWNVNDFNIFLVTFLTIGGLPIVVSGYMIWRSEYLFKDDASKE